MIYQIFVVYDSKARAHLLPYFASTVDVGLRSFQGAAQQKGSPIGDYPADFTLYHTGSWDDERATFSLFPQPLNCGTANQFLKDLTGQHRGLRERYTPHPDELTIKE